MPLLNSKRTRNRALNAAAWLTLAALLALVAGTLPAVAGDLPTESCAPQAETGYEPGVNDSNHFQVSERRFHFPFGESRRADSLTRKVDAFGDLPRNVSAKIYESIVSAEGHPVGGFKVSARVERAGALPHPSVIGVCVSLDPARIRDLRPGRYEGTVVVRADKYGQDAAIPISATFRAPRRDAMTMAAAGVAVGLLVKMLTELASGRRAKRKVGALRAARVYLFEWSFPLALILGVLAGWLGFIEMYESNATWGVGNGTDSLKLFATCFAFQMGSIGSADLTKRLVG